MQCLRMLEPALRDSEMDREPPQPETQEMPTDPGYLIAFAFRRLVDGSRAISLASRYESRLHRIHERSHRTLRELQNNPSVSAGTPEPVSPAPVEPEPPSALTPQAYDSDEKSPNEPTQPAPTHHLPI